MDDDEEDEKKKKKKETTLPLPFLPSQAVFKVMEKGPAADQAAVSYILVFNAWPTSTVISRRYTDIKVDSLCGTKGRF